MRNVNALLAVVAMIAGACGTDERLPTGARAGESTITAVIRGAESSWNFAAFDVTSWREGGDSTSWRPVQQRPRRVHIERWLRADGWHTRVVTPSPANVAADAGLITTVEFGPDGTVTGAFDARGVGVSVAHLPGITGRHPSAAPSVAALDFLVVTPGAKARMEARLAAQVGPSAVAADTLAYVESVGRATAHRVYDRRVGAVVRDDITDATGTATHISRKFVSAADGFSILRRLTIVSERPGGGQGRFVQEFSNVRVEARNR